MGLMMQVDNGRASTEYCAVLRPASIVADGKVGCNSTGQALSLEPKKRDVMRLSYDCDCR